MTNPARPTVVIEADRGIIRIAGADRRSWLDGIVSCDLSALDRGGVYGLFLNKQGKIQTDLDVVAGDDAVFVTLAPGQTEATVAALDRMLIMEEAELTNESSELCVVRVHGADADAWVREHLQTVAFGAVDWTGLGGVCAIVRRDALDALSTHDDPDAWAMLRVARGFGVYGVDYDCKDNPREAALDRRAVSFSKGCYLGQEVVCMQDMRGKLKRRLCILDVASQSVAFGARVEHKGTDVGEVRSVAPRGGLCLARVAAPHFEIGSALGVAGAAAAVVGPQGA